MRIGAPDGFSTYYLTHALRDFAERHPGVRLQLMPLPQLTPLARREVDVVVGLDKPEAGRFVARKLTDYTLGIYASAAYLKQNGAPADVEDLKRRRLIGYVEEHAFSTALDYVRELYDGAPTMFECASAVTQLEALRAGVGLGVVHDFIARRFRDLVRVLPERRATRSLLACDARGHPRPRTHPRRRRPSGARGGAGLGYFHGVSKSPRSIGLLNGAAWQAQLCLLRDRKDDHVCTHGGRCEVAVQGEERQTPAHGEFKISRMIGCEALDPR